LQVAKQRLAFEAEKSDQELKTQTRIAELSQQLSTQKQSSEQQEAATAQLLSQLHEYEKQHMANVDSESPLRCTYRVQRAFAEIQNLERQHQETMRSTQASLLEAQVELQAFVEVGSAIPAPAFPDRQYLIFTLNLLIRHSLARSFRR
jgi:hypothetical protein